LDWTETPEVRWRRPEDEAAVADPDAWVARVEHARDRVWDRIPDRHKAVLSETFRHIRLAWVPGREDPVCPVRDSLARLSGACRPGPGITINLAMLQHCDYPDDDLLFTLAHELGHAVDISERICVAHYAREFARSPGSAWALREQYEDVARLYEGPLVQYVDLDDPHNELLADARVLSWGFGTELAKSRALDCIDDPMPDPEGEKGLMPEFAEVYHTIQWRIDRQPWEEALPVALELEAPYLDLVDQHGNIGCWRFEIGLDYLMSHSREATKLICREEPDNPDQVIIVPNEFFLTQLENFATTYRGGEIRLDLRLAMGGGGLRDIRGPNGLDFAAWREPIRAEAVAAEEAGGE